MYRKVWKLQNISLFKGCAVLWSVLKFINSFLSIIQAGIDSADRGFYKSGAQFKENFLYFTY